MAVAMITGPAPFQRHSDATELDIALNLRNSLDIALNLRNSQNMKIVLVHVITPLEVTMMTSADTMGQFHENARYTSRLDTRVGA